MQVTVTLIALPAWPLDAHGAGEHHTLTTVAQRVTLPEGARVADLLQALDLHPGEVLLVLINGAEGDHTHPLRDGDAVVLNGPFVGD
jgi:sulfur carrier protein ThiS